MSPAPRAATDAPTDLMLAALDHLGPPLRPLVIGEARGRIAAAVRRLGGAPAEWLREAGGAIPAATWPPEGDLDAALIRLPKAKDALEMALHAAAAQVPPGAPIAVFGANAEGIRSAARLMDPFIDTIETLAVGHHARVLTGPRRLIIDGLRPRLADWRRLARLTLEGRDRPWVSYPGTFARGGLDAGTAFLLAHLPPVPDDAHVLDFAAGTGVIAASIASRAPAARVEMLEADALALAAAGENVPGARATPGTTLDALADRRFDLIVSNPPVHVGIAESRAVLDRLIADAPRHLASGGRLTLVVQRRIPVVASLARVLADAKVIADDGRYTVATACRASARA